MCREQVSLKRSINRKHEVTTLKVKEAQVRNITDSLRKYNWKLTRKEKCYVPEDHQVYRLRYVVLLS